MADSHRANRWARIGASVTIGAVSVALVGVLAWWLVNEPPTQPELRLPGADGRPARSVAADVVEIGAYFGRFAPTPVPTTGSWPQFRGANRDNVSIDGPALTRSLGPDGPPVVWQVDLGDGYAGAAVHEGLVYVLDYDMRNKADMLRCFSLETGQEIWRRWYLVPAKSNHGISRTVPAVDDRFVVTIGPRCHVMCVDARSGDFLWGIDLQREYGTQEPLWYAGQCPFLDDGVAVIAVGGDVLMIGVDCASGEVVWSTPNPGGVAMSHSSVMPMTLHDTDMYVYCGIGGTVGVSADPDKPGELLWFTDEFDATVISPSPVAVSDSKVFVTAGYGYGSMLLEVFRDADGFGVRSDGRKRPGEGLSLEQQTPLRVDDLLVGVAPKDAGALQRQCVGYDPAGEVIWSSGETDRFGWGGPFLLADDLCVMLNDLEQGRGAELILATINRGGFEVIDRANVLDGGDPWAPLALANGYLVARDFTSMVCFDLRADP